MAAVTKGVANEVPLKYFPLSLCASAAQNHGVGLVEVMNARIKEPDTNGTYLRGFNGYFPSSPKASVGDLVFYPGDSRQKHAGMTAT